MEIQYVEPLKKAWERTKHILFSPFDLGRWLTIAFAAWLAGLAGGGAGGGNPGLRFGPGRRMFFLPRHPWHPFQGRFEPGLWIPIAAVAVVLVLALLVLLLWLSSRGKFVFLDDVVRERGAVREPWRRFAEQGDSLFLWRLGFALVCLLVAGFLAAVVIGLAGGPWHLGFSSGRAIAATLFATVALALFALAVAAVSLILDGFIVPIMYATGLKATEAWRQFLPWLERYAGSFVFYGLFVLVLWIGVAAAVLTAGLFTCCIGLLVLAIPYVGTAILLPVYVAYRAYSLEFLAQFHPGFVVLPPLAPPAPDPPAGGEPPAPPHS